MPSREKRKHYVSNYGLKKVLGFIGNGLPREIKSFRTFDLFKSKSKTMLTGSREE